MNAAVDYLPQPPKRPELARLVGRCVTAEGTYQDKTKPYRRKALLTLVTNVTVTPSITVWHVWVDLPEPVTRKLEAGQRFRFRARVYEYRRRDGTWDYGLSFVEWVQQGRVE